MAQAARRWLQFAGGLAALAAVVLLYRQLDVNPTTVGLTLVLVILIFAAFSTLSASILLAVVATLCFNYFFLPPLHTFVIADTQNWIALFAFLVTAVVGSQLAERARRQSAQAEERRAEAERLYRELLKERAGREAEQLRSALLDSVAHYFRTPLTAIKASVTSLLSGPAPSASDSAELLQVIDEEADRLNHLLGQALDMARLDTGDVQLQIASHPVREAVETALERTHRLLQGRPLQVELPPDLPAVAMDLERTAQVFVHLLDNAARYSPAGSGIRVAARPQGEMVLASVSDSGPGIPEAEQADIFDKFYRGREQRGATKGTGLGLSIVRAIVTAQGGQVGVRSCSGKGAELWFTLPRDQAGP